MKLNRTVAVLFALLFALLFAVPAAAQSIVVDKPSTTGNPGVVKVTNTAGNKSNADAVVVLNADGTIFTGAVTCASCATAANQVTAQTTLDALNTKAGVANAVLNSILVKQPALGTAGVSSTDVITVQGIASGTPQPVSGAVAHDAVDSGNPVKMGCYAASTTPPTAVSVADRANLYCALTGALVAAGPSVAATGADASSNNIQTFGDAFGATLKLQVRPEGFNGTTWDRLRTLDGASAGTGVGILAVGAVPSSNANGGIVPSATTAVASSIVAKASAGNVYRVSATTGITAGYLMGFNATSAPADGAVTPVMCRVIAANSTLSVSYADMPSYWSTGITFVFSSTGCFIKTASATAFIEYSVK